MFPDRIGAAFGITLLLVATVAAGAVPSAAATANDGFEVEITETNAPVTGGETLEVTATVTNNGDTEESQQIHLKDEGEVILDSVADPPLTLAPGESEEVTLTWETDANTESGNVSVQSNDDGDHQWMEVRDGPAFDVAVDAGNVSATAGDNVTVTATVSNDGNEAGSTPVWLAVDGETESERTVDLAAGETTQVDLTWQTTEGDAGEWTLTVDTDGDSTTMHAAIAEVESPTNGDDSAGDDSGDDDSDESFSPPVPNIVSERSHALIEGTVANVSSHDVDRVEFATAVDGKITADELRETPEGVDSVDGAIGLYRVSVPDQATDTAATVTFTLDADRLGGASTETVLVKHWDGENWTDLNTTATTEDGVVRIQAETDGFSVFAVTTDGEEPTPTATETATETDQPTETATSTDTESASDSTSTDGTPADEMETVAQAPGFGVITALLAALVAVVLRVAYSQRN